MGDQFMSFLIILCSGHLFHVCEVERLPTVFGQHYLGIFQLFSFLYPRDMHTKHIKYLNIFTSDLKLPQVYSYSSDCFLCAQYNNFVR